MTTKKISKKEEQEMRFTRELIQKSKLDLIQKIVVLSDFKIESLDKLNKIFDIFKEGAK